MKPLEVIDNIPAASFNTSGQKEHVQNKAKVNLDAHEGLRGIAALWVVFFHCFIYSTIPLNFQGSSLMPLFYLLTGLTHALVYNKLFPT